METVTIQFSERQIHNILGALYDYKQALLDVDEMEQALVMTDTIHHIERALYTKSKAPRSEPQK